MTVPKSNEIKFTIGSGVEIRLMTVPGVFAPNMTTTLLIQAVNETIMEPVTLLDLGCGTGVVGIALHQQGLIKSPLYASDMSESAAHCARKNCDSYGCVAKIYSGSLFNPWKDKKFDVIVDDISGIAQGVAEVSPWFQGVPCDTGEDGTDLVVEILRTAPHHLKEGGCMFFPVLSLSNVDMLLKVAKENFATIKKVGFHQWPLPEELKVHMPLLQKLKAEGLIELEERFGMVLCYTEVYCSSNPYLINEK